MSRFAFLLIAFLMLMPTGIWAQEVADDENVEATEADIKMHMLTFEEELNQLYVLSMFQLNIDNEMPLTEPLLDVISQRIKSLNTALNSFVVRWNTYSQAHQVYVAENDSLLNLVATIQQKQQAVSDTLAARKQQYDYLAAFTKAETFIYSCDSTYRRLYDKAVPLSLVSALAPQLEKVKASEQLIFADLQNSYNQAKEAAEAFPGLDLRMQGLELKYIELKSVSGKIQELAYKPFIQRIKDYLLGLAAVAILLMFINLMWAKIKLAKQAYQQAKKMKDLMNGQNNYPTI